MESRITSDVAMLRRSDFSPTMAAFDWRFVGLKPDLHFDLKSGRHRDQRMPGMAVTGFRQPRAIGDRAR